MSANPQQTTPSALANPWVQLIIGVVCMACVANLQYGWTLFVNPIDAKYHWGRSAIQVAFTIFVLIETWLIPVEGYLVDRFGPRWVVLGGAILVALAWVLNAGADSLAVLYVGAALGGIGTGCIYGTCVGNALKWFPGRRGLAAGITAAGFGAGAAITIGPISSMINTAGYEHAFMFFGLLQGAIVFVMAWLLLTPPPQIATAKVKPNQTAHGYTPSEVLRSPVFYVLYLMFVLIAAGGLTMAASMAPIAKDLKIDKVPVELFGFVMPALVFALSLNRIFDGVGRPFFGWLSDQIGREYTMALAFLVGAASLFILSQSGANPVVFVIVTALYFGVYGEIFSLFPATQGDTFGSKYAASNAGMLYTAKGAGALLVPIAAGIAKTHGWGTVFSIAMTFNVIAGLLALFVLKPMRLRHFAKSRDIYPDTTKDTSNGVTSTRAT
ncbi:MAG: transporter, family, oxalate/formate antiporter [Gammaproteobacteria bacterium]|jgi:OFA family oxalate/formate antiporter-like MFS transporter|nr:transporter, family, oxalate/formate antiporter [Gammaproteobacteria bacterium]